MTETPNEAAKTPGAPPSKPPRKPPPKPSRPTPTPDPEPDDAAASALLAKWLIPSAAVLFAAMGYVVQSAQQSLLGVEFAAHENTAYFNTAADFLRDAAVRLLAWPMRWPGDLLLHRPWLVLYALIMVAGASAATLSPRLRRRFGRRRVVLAAALAIASVVGMKFLLMDGPLLKIQDLAASGDGACWSLAAQPQDRSQPSSAQSGDSSEQPDLRCDAMQSARGAEALVWNQASEVVGELVCSRVTASAAATLPRPIAESQACKRSMAQNQAALGDEFLCNLVLELLTIGAALLVLRRASHNFGATALCLLILTYGLSAPYAYGKVGMTQLFESGDARISQALQDSYRAENPALLMQKGRAPGVNPPKGDIPHKGDKHAVGWVPGVILHKDDKGASILTMRKNDCGGTRASLSFITSSQLMSFDQIDKVDLITWLATRQISCPGI